MFAALVYGLAFAGNPIQKDMVRDMLDCMEDTIGCINEVPYLDFVYGTIPLNSEG